LQIILVEELIIVEIDIQYTDIYW